MHSVAKEFQKPYNLASVANKIESSEKKLINYAKDCEVSSVLRGVH